MSGVDPNLFYIGAVGAVAFATGLFVNRPKITRVLTFAGSVLSVLQSCSSAIEDGTETAEEERRVGQATIAAYREGGDTLKAIVER